MGVTTEVRDLLVLTQFCDVEERNNIIQSNIHSEAVNGKGHSNAWPGTAS
jgi:hypothetical protein